MDIKITGRHLELPEEIKTLAEKKLGKLGKFDPGIQSIEVILTKEKLQNKVEILVKSRHYKVEAVGLHQDLHACLDDVLGKIERRLRQQREKVIDKKHRKSATVPETVEEPDESEE